VHTRPVCCFEERLCIVTPRDKVVRNMFVPKRDQVAIVASLLNMVIILEFYENLVDIFDSLSDYRLFKKKWA
jgi:hypothetical protein